MTQLSSSDVPGMGRRQFMNLLTFGSVTGVALGALYPVVNYFIPPKAAGSAGRNEVVGDRIESTQGNASHRAEGQQIHELPTTHSGHIARGGLGHGG